MRENHKIHSESLQAYETSQNLHEYKTTDEFTKEFMSPSHSMSFLFFFFFFHFLAPCLISPTEAQITKWQGNQIVDKVGSTVFHKNIFFDFATGETITKADFLGNFTISHCRMSTIQPTWPVCTTSVCWDTCCWHFCSCSSHKTIPPLKLSVTRRWIMVGCYVIAFSFRICQICVVVTTIV